MYAEFIVPNEDLERILRRAVPLTIYPEGIDVAHTLEITELSEVQLVADLGLRIVCKAMIRWPVLGITVPIALKSATLVLLPTIEREGDHERLAFRISLEHADFSALPTVIDNKLTETINAKLAGKDVELSWDFTKALTTIATLPAILPALASFAIRPAWAKIRVTAEAIVYAVSFHADVVRKGESPAAEFVAP